VTGFAYASEQRPTINPMEMTIRIVRVMTPPSDVLSIRRNVTSVAAVSRLKSGWFLGWSPE
jgi:hypothetical protein